MVHKQNLVAILRKNDKGKKNVNFPDGPPAAALPPRPAPPRPALSDAHPPAAPARPAGPPPARWVTFEFGGFFLMVVLRFLQMLNRCHVLTIASPCQLSQGPWPVGRSPALS